MVTSPRPQGHRGSGVGPRGDGVLLSEEGMVQKQNICLQFRAFHIRENHVLICKNKVFAVTKFNLIRIQHLKIHVQKKPIEHILAAKIKKVSH